MHKSSMRQTQGGIGSIALHRPIAERRSWGQTQARSLTIDGPEGRERAIEEHFAWRGTLSRSCPRAERGQVERVAHRRRYLPWRLSTLEDPPNHSRRK